jgi:hypothetical protein
MFAIVDLKSKKPVEKCVHRFRKGAIRKLKVLQDNRTWKSLRKAGYRVVGGKK